LRPDLPGALGEIVARALQKNPADRYGNWAEFALDLAKAGRLSIYDRGIPDSERFTALKRCALLADLDDGEIWEFVAIGKWSRLPSYHMVVREGDPGDSIFLLAEGEAKVTLAGRLLNVLAAGEWFGEQPYIQGRPVRRQASVQTTADSVLVEFPRASLEKLGDRSKQRFSLALLRTLAERLSLSNVRISRMDAE
jgi:CRP-like cAMP-binding protein